MVVTVPKEALRPGDDNLVAFYSEDTFYVETYINVRITLKDSLGCSTAVYSINGILPDEFGNFTIVGDNGVDVTRGTNRIFIDSFYTEALVCDRIGDPGDPGPPGPAGPNGAPGLAPPPKCCSCNTCEKCNTCEQCNTSEGWNICGECDTKIRECGTLADAGYEVTGNTLTGEGGVFELITPLDEDPCDC
jgi:hypothetical protein